MKLHKTRNVLRNYLPIINNILCLPNNFLRNNKIDLRAVISKDTQMNSTIIEKYSYIGRFGVYNSVCIGKYTSIGPFVTIGGAEHSYWWYSTSHFLSKKNIGGIITTIGNDVWVGSHVVIRQGVTIGDGAIIGAGSVVLHDVEPYSIVVGVPAKLLKMRFNNKTIDILRSINYWKYRPLKAIEVIESNFIEN